MRTKALISILCGLLLGTVLASNPMFRVMSGSSGGGSSATPTPAGATITTSGDWIATSTTTTTVITPTRTLTGTGTIKFSYDHNGLKVSKNGAAFTTQVNGSTMAIASGDTIRMETTTNCFLGHVLDNYNDAIIGTIDIENSTCADTGL